MPRSRVRVPLSPPVKSSTWLSARARAIAKSGVHLEQRHLGEVAGEFGEQETLFLDGEGIRFPFVRIVLRPHGRARTGSLTGRVNARQNSQIVFLRLLSGWASVRFIGIRIFPVSMAIRCA